MKNMKRMIKTLLLSTLLFLTTSPINAQNTTRVKATQYNPSKKHNSVTADGSKIHHGKLKKKQIRWVAVSRDLLKEFPYGTKIQVDSDRSDICGVWEVHDTMHKRHTKSVDFLFAKGHSTLGVSYVSIIKSPL